MSYCAYCNKEVDGDAILCEDCQHLADNGTIVICDHCQEWHYAESTDEVRVRWHNTETWCCGCIEDYAVKCEDCGCYAHPDNIDEDTNGFCLCGSCREDYYYCTDCGRFVHTDYTEWYNDDPYCESCCPSDEVESGINDYGLKPAPKFHFGLLENKGSDGTIFMGIELEAGGLTSRYDAGNSADRTFDQGGGYLYCKYDCSIPQYGYEVVSHPGTLQYHREFCWEAILKEMSEAGLRSHDIEKCGLHIHINREALPTSTWLLADWFVNNNQDFWIKCARRGSTGYAKYLDKSTIADKSVQFTQKYGEPFNRYRAVNFCNDATVEFRFWKGTLKYSSFMAKLELQYALIRWLQEVQVHEVADSTYAFAQFKEYCKAYYPKAYDYAASLNAWDEVPVI